MEEYKQYLKETKGYDDQMLSIIHKIILAFNEVLGDENMPNVLQAIKNVQIILYKDVSEASTMLSEYYNNGKKYRVGVQATGTGFTEDEYFYNENGELKQQLVIGLDKNKLNVHTLVHELCHAISFIDGYFVKDNILYTTTGFDQTTYDFSGGMKGDALNNNGRLFNEIVTENLSMQVMDAYDKTVSHEAIAYNGYATNFKNIFRNKDLNKMIIESYINHDNNFLTILNEIVDHQTYINSVNTLYNVIDNNNHTIKEYLDKLSNLTFSDFFKVYFTYVNKTFGTLDGVDKNDFRIMRQINQEIIIAIGSNLQNKEIDRNKL